MSFGGRGAVAVEWGSEVSGFTGLTQKAICGVMTQAGSDELNPTRGTDALKELVGYGAYDLMSIQHTLNFAAQKAANDTKNFESSADPAYQLRSVRMRLMGLNGGAAQAMVTVSNQAGETTNDNIAIE